MIDHALHFVNGATLFISFYDEEIIKQIIRNILDSPEMFCGMRVVDIRVVNNPDFTDCEYFLCASPIFIKRRLNDGTIKQYCFNDEEANALMRDTLMSKMQEAGMPEDNTLDIKFDSSYVKKKTKLVRYHNIGNKANFCPIFIKGKPETKLFAWNVGVGNCTGIGFGAIY